MSKQFDVCIIGAGPAGLFCAYELSVNSDLKIVVFEKGKDIKERKCSLIDSLVCRSCKLCNLLCGIGGAGGLSDGKLNLRYDVGGNLAEFLRHEDAERIVKYVDSIFLECGAPREIKTPKESLTKKAISSGIKFLPIPQRHIGTDNLPKVFCNLMRKIQRKNIEIRPNTEVIDIERKGGRFAIKTTKGVFYAKYVVVAVGRSGISWFEKIAGKFGIKLRYLPIDIGVRVEVPNMIFKEIFEHCIDPKFYIRTKTYDDFVRTFCTCYGGYVVRENYKEFVCINGHSLRKFKSENTNFALLVQVELTEPVEDTISYGREIAKLATTIGGGKPILQRFGDLIAGRRSTWRRIRKSYIEPTLKDVTPGDIAMALPHRIVTDIIEALEKMDRVIEGVASPSTLLYCPEIKFYAKRTETNKNLETKVENLFVAGDGAGVSRDIVNAAATGIIAARGILAKI